MLSPRAPVIRFMGRFGAVLRQLPSRPNRPAVASLEHGKKNRSDAPQTSRRPRSERGRAASLRSQPRRHPGRTVAHARKLSPLPRLIHTLKQEKIRFQVAGMSAAILQGCPATTLDTDLWIDLPPRQYMRVLQLCRKLGAAVRANTVVDLSDGSMINFLYRVDGLFSFDREYRNARRLRWLGTTVPVLPLARILRSKQVVGRPKDLAHIPLLRQTIRLSQRNHPSRRK